MLFKEVCMKKYSSNPTLTTYQFLVNNTTNTTSIKKYFNIFLLDENKSTFIISVLWRLFNSLLNI